MTENLIEDRPDIAAELRSILDGWTERKIASEDGQGVDPLARTAHETGPYLYVNPNELEAVYRDLGRSPEQFESLFRHSAFPRPLESPDQ